MLTEDYTDADSFSNKRQPAGSHKHDKGFRPNCSADGALSRVSTANFPAAAAADADATFGWHSAEISFFFIEGETCLGSDGPCTLNFPKVWAAAGEDCDALLPVFDVSSCRS